LDVKPCSFEEIKECWWIVIGRRDGGCSCLYGGKLRVG
jgi:hypothetical protein